MVGGARVAILDLDFSRADVAFRHRGVRVGPVGATLTAAAADALNGAFGLPAGTVPAGLKLGDATVHYRLSHHERNRLARGRALAGAAARAVTVSGGASRRRGRRARAPAAG
jgi:hypothetical protein